MMRKELLVLGLALLFSGIIATSMAVNIQGEKIISREPATSKHAIDLENQPWSVSLNFSKGRKLYAYIVPGKYWCGEPTPGMNILNLSVTIIDPKGSETRLRVIFSSDPLAPEPKLQLHAVQVVSNEGGLVFEKSNVLETTDGTTYYREISAIVCYDGSYNMTVTPTFGTLGPPAALGLQSLLIEKVYPYWYVILMGVGFMVAGVFLLIWVWKNPKYKKRRKARRS